MLWALGTVVLVDGDLASGQLSQSTRGHAGGRTGTVGDGRVAQDEHCARPARGECEKAW